jgi:hypothetical protein
LITSKNLLIVILLYLRVTVIQAQDADYFNGYVITKDNDTIYGKLKFIEPFLHYIKTDAKFNKEENASFEKYSVDGIKGFSIGQTTYHSVRFQQFNNTAKVAFMRLVLDGDVKLYTWEVKVAQETYEQQSHADVSHSYLMKKNDNEAFSVPRIGFKSKLANYFADHPELSEKIKKGFYKRSDLEEIVTKYNQWKSPH